MTIPSLPRLVGDSRIQVSLVLIGVWLVALLTRFSWQRLFFPLLSVVLIVGADMFFALIKRKRIRFPRSSWVTGLLLGLILEPHEYVWLSFILATMIASTTKQLLRLNSRHIFNPAAIGLVTTSLITGAPIAWWAAAASPLTMVVVFLGMGYILWKIKRLWLPVVFFVSYAFYLLSTSGLLSVVPLLVDPTTVFFAFIMLPEPLTAPAQGMWRFAWGVLVVILIAFYARLHLTLADPFLGALLSANGIAYSMNRGFQILFSRRGSSKEEVVEGTTN